jgi:hypothetical protein
MTSNRRVALVVGVLFLITFATSIPALWAFQPVLDSTAGHIAGRGQDAAGAASVGQDAASAGGGVGAAGVALAAIKDWTFCSGPASLSASGTAYCWAT